MRGVGSDDVQRQLDMHRAWPLAFEHGEGAGQQTVLDVYSNIGWIAIGVGIAVLVVAPLIKKLMHLDTLQDDSPQTEAERVFGDAEAQQAGIRPANRGRKAGDWELGQLLDEGPGWQDFEGTRPQLDARRRALADEQGARGPGHREHHIATIHAGAVRAADLHRARRVQHLEHPARAVDAEQMAHQQQVPGG